MDARNIVPNKSAEMFWASFGCGLNVAFQDYLMALSLVFGITTGYDIVHVNVTDDYNIGYDIFIDYADGNTTFYVTADTNVHIVD